MKIEDVKEEFEKLVVSWIKKFSENNLSPLSLREIEFDDIVRIKVNNHANNNFDYSSLENTIWNLSIRGSKDNLYIEKNLMDKDFDKFRDLYIGGWHSSFTLPSGEFVINNDGDVYIQFEFVNDLITFKGKYKVIVKETLLDQVKRLEDEFSSDKNLLMNIYNNLYKD